MKKLSFLVLVLVGCGGDNQKVETPTLSGNFRLTDLKCQTTSVSIEGLQDSFFISGTNLSGTRSTQDCTDTVSGKFYEGQPFGTMEFTNRSCSPNPCTLAFKVGGTDRNWDCTTTVPGNLTIKPASDLKSFTVSAGVQDCNYVYTKD